MISEVEATQFSLIISDSTAAVCSLTNPGVTYESIFMMISELIAIQFWLTIF